MKEELSCGTVPFCLKNGVRHYLLISPVDRGWYGFPKGHIEEGESREDAALRETLEETSLAVKLLSGFCRSVRYSPSKGVMKNVVYFLASFEGTPRHKRGFEHMKYAVLPYEMALEKLSHEQTRRVLREAEKFLSEVRDDDLS